MWVLTHIDSLSVRQILSFCPNTGFSWVENIVEHPLPSLPTPSWVLISDQFLCFVCDFWLHSSVNCELNNLSPTCSSAFFPPPFSITFYLFKKHLLNSCYLPCMVLGMEASAYVVVNKMDKNPCLLGDYTLMMGDKERN